MKQERIKQRSLKQRKDEIGKLLLMKEIPECERPREKLLRDGASVLSNAELLAILIGSGVRNQSAISLANQILAMEEEGIACLADCLPEELTLLKGVGQAKACQIIAAIEVGKRIAQAPKKERLRPGSPNQLAELFLQKVRGYKKEVFQIVLLNTPGEVVSIEEISVGSLSKAIVHPREVFRIAVRKSAAYLVLVHNHPSGDPKPSQADIELTHRLTECGRLMGIEVLDHLVIGDGTFTSMKEQGLI